MCFGVRTQKENYAQTLCINMEETKNKQVKNWKVNKRERGRVVSERERERDGGIKMI